MLPIEADPKDMALSVELQMTGNMEDITYHAQYAKLMQSVGSVGQQVTRPGDEIVGELGQQHQHLP